MPSARLSGWQAPDARPGRPLATARASSALIESAIHPYVGIGVAPATNHQPEFAAHCVGQPAREALLDGASALARTGIDRALNPDV